LSVFDLHRRVISDDAGFVQSHFTIADRRVREHLPRHAGGSSPVVRPKGGT
jgi:hypothetical protein